jgi:cytochrome c-type biogenesis protein CcmH
MRKSILLGGLAALGLVGTAAAVVVHRHHDAVAADPAPRHRLIFATPQEAPGDPAKLAAAAQARPGDAGAWARVGNAYLRQRSFGPAIAAYKKTLALDPRRAETWSALGEAYIQSQRATSAAMPADAADAFTRALALDPTNLRARFYKTMERDFAGEHDRAVGEWLGQLREAPMGSDADQAIRAALGFSINRNLSLIKAEMAKATQAQPRVAEKTAG